MQQLVRRQCQSEKECSECKREIGTGEFYYSNPNQSLCEDCKNKKELEEKSKKEVIAPIVDIEKPLGDDKVHDYTKLGSCKFCDKPAENTVRGIPCCFNHIDEATEETV